MRTYGELATKKFIEVYSSQKSHVVDRLKESLTYIPKWNESAACDPNIGEVRRLLHESAYLWKMDQFEKRFKRRPRDGLFWVCLDKSSLKIMEKNNPENKLIALNIPVEEILISSLIDWEHVLQHDVWDGNRWVMTLQEPSELTRQSWEIIFKIPNNYPLSSLQGVMDRVEPGWVQEIS